MYCVLGSKPSYQIFISLTQIRSGYEVALSATHHLCLVLELLPCVLELTIAHLILIQ
jgi:hypothetical protein